jgi:ATP-dependent RNA helicase RhlE
MTTFSELPLSSALQQKLAAAQFINLTPIQERAIPPALEGRDVIGTAQTGTGKTLAFLLPLIEILKREPAAHTVALVLLPTRELAMQVHEQYEQLRTKCGKPHSSSAAYPREPRFRLCARVPGWSSPHPDDCRI